MGFVEIGNKVHQVGEGCDGLSVLPSSLSLKVVPLKLRSIHLSLSQFLRVFLHGS